MTQTVSLANPGQVTLNLSDAGHWLLLVLIAALAGLLVEVIRRGAIPLGFVGEMVFAAIGAWLGGDLLQTRFPVLTQPAMEGVAVIPAVVGALLLGFLWGMLGGRPKRRY